jgi:hypothetical protein
MVSKLQRATQTFVVKIYLHRSIRQNWELPDQSLHGQIQHGLVGYMNGQHLETALTSLVVVAPVLWDFHLEQMLNGHNTGIFAVVRQLHSTVSNNNHSNLKRIRGSENA